MYKSWSISPEHNVLWVTDYRQRGESSVMTRLPTSPDAKWCALSDSVHLYQEKAKMPLVQAITVVGNTAKTESWLSLFHFWHSIALMGLSYKNRTKVRTFSADIHLIHLWNTGQGVQDSIQKSYKCLFQQIWFEYFTVSKKLANLNLLKGWTRSRS